jgi:cell wall-associated NlpC family hydrolase
MSAQRGDLQDLLQAQEMHARLSRVVRFLRFRSRRLALLGLAALLGTGALAAAPAPVASGQASIDTERQAADRLRAAVAAEDARIAATSDGLADAERRLGILVARVRAADDQLAAAQDALIRSRIRLSQLQRREAQSKHVLADSLVANYKAGQPQLTDIILGSTSFADLYHRLEVLKRAAQSNANLLEDTKRARADVVVETNALERRRAEYSDLAKAAVADRDRADALRGALLARQERQLAHRDGVATQLVAVRARISRLQRAQAAAARRAAQAATATSEAPVPRVTGGSADAIVARVVAAANQIATTPYVWGGGHGGASGGYDCSGSVSYALAAGGLLSSPLDSTGFMSWGAPGPGSRITVYANSGHAFMIVDGRRFDTSALSGGGTRWTSAARSTAGFVARHPPGL